MPIKSAREKTDEAVKSIAKFQKGEILPISTGFEWLDKHLLGGFLPSTIVTIGGLSNHGKTYLMQKIENNVIDNNTDVVLLRCNWESAVYKLLLRKITQKTDMKILRRINTLIKEIKRNPFEGIGKPEPLKHALSGYWSRRINDEHRIVYKASSDAILIAQLRYHY